MQQRSIQGSERRDIFGSYLCSFCARAQTLAHKLAKELANMQRLLYNGRIFCVRPRLPGGISMGPKPKGPTAEEEAALEAARLAEEKRLAEEAQRKREELERRKEAARKVAEEEARHVDVSLRKDALCDTSLARLLADLRNENRNVRWSAANSLGRLGPSAAPYAAQVGVLLSDPDRNLRWSAAYAIGMIGSSASSQAQALADLLHDSEEGVRRAAVEALGKMGPVVASHAAAVASLLKDDALDVQICAADTLQAMGPSIVKEVAPAVVTLLRATRRDVRQNALDALGKMGPTVLEVVPRAVVAELLRDGDGYVRSAAARALQRMGVPPYGL